MNRVGRTFLIVSITGLIVLVGTSAHGDTKSVKISEAKKGEGVVVAVSDLMLERVRSGALRPLIHPVPQSDR